MVAIFSQQNNSKSKLFAKKEGRESYRFIFAAVLSIFIMFSDYHYRYLHYVRNGVAIMVTPLQYLVDYPVRVIGGMQSLVGSKKNLIDENIKLHHQQTLLEAELQKLLVLQEENLQLKELLLTSSQPNIRAMAAQILAVDTNPTRQMVILNKGKNEGVHVGQPVLDAKGVMGQVIDTGSMTSTVLLISDSKSAVPVRSNRTGERAILVGTNNMSQLSLINLPKTSSINVGDLLVTSGLGGLYPEGYPVGIVESVENIPGDAFIKINVSPVASLNRTRLVLLIWSDKNQIALNEQINERLNKIEAIS